MYSCGINNCRHTTQTLGAMLDHKHEHVINQMGDTITALRTENAALTARVKELEAHLNQYLVQFDDESLTNEQVKHWLDAYWIPTTRRALCEASEMETK